MHNTLEHLREFIEELSDEQLREIVLDMSIQDIVELWQDLKDVEAINLFLLLPIDKKAELITELGAADQERLIKSFPLDNAREIFEKVEPDDLVDIIQELNPEVRENVWQSLSDEARSQMQFLLRFDEEHAAGIMTTRYLAIRPDITVGQALAFVRMNARRVETIYYIYVVDTLKRLQGVVSLKDLLFSEDTSRIDDVMTHKVITVAEDADQEEVAKTLEANDLIALPVVDTYNRLLGIVTFDDAIDVIREEQTEDVYKMGAMEGSVDRYTESSVWRLIRKRVPWLIVLLVAGTLTTNVLNAFEPLTLAAGFLVWFVPVITQTGGNSGTQSSTLMIRGIATGEVRFRDLGLVMFKELTVGVIMGLILAGVIMLRSVYLPPGIDWIQALAVGAALVFVVVFSSVIGAFAPLFIHRLGFDPTVMAGPLMATVIDVAGLTIYFRAARLILGL
ncbi:MAG: magnesium transporter [Spirochaetales bacterium]|nr:magnesium transporter [Spirochaetales bacterium]